MNTILRTLIEALEKIFVVYAKTFFSISQTIFEFGPIRIGIVATRADRRPFEDRIAKIDVAREALIESLSAIDQMKSDAQAAKDEYLTNNANLKAIFESSQDAEEKLANIRASMQQDISAFQTLAGVPNLKRERWIAFLAGVLASTVSAGLVALGVWGWAKIF